MRVKCPECGYRAFLDDKYLHVRCDLCGYESTYLDYVKRLAVKDPVYRNIMEDYG